MLNGNLFSNGSALRKLRAGVIHCAHIEINKIPNLHSFEARNNVGNYIDRENNGDFLFLG